MAAIPGYLTVYEAAEVIGVSHSQCTRYIAEGLLDAADLGHQKLIREEDAKAFNRPPKGNPQFKKAADSRRKR